MKTIIVNRDFGDKDQTLGVMYVVENCELLFKSECIERGWVDNEQRVSCIPVGEYKIVLEYSPRFDMDLWEIYGVEGRSECKIHSANYARQLNGCIAPGLSRADIDGDGNIDVASSKKALKAFHKAMGEDTEARIIIRNVIDNV